MAQESKNSSKLLVTLSAAVVAAAAVPQIAQASEFISCPQDLVFGTIIACPGTGTARVTAGGTRTLTGCLTSGGAGTVSQGRCFVSDGSFPASPIVVSITGTHSINNGGGGTMTASGFDVSTSTATGTNNSVTVTATSTDIFFGATLSVGASQPSGVYSGGSGAIANANYQ